MDWMNYVDVSSSILFEATADSEAGSDVNKDMDHALLRDDMGLADDDALSCSCDDIDFKDFDYSTADHQFDLVDEDKELADRYKYFNDDIEEEEEEEGAVDQQRIGDRKVNDLNPQGEAASRGILMGEKQQKKLKVCADSVKEFMNDRDKDRLFWETCLAS